MEKKTLNFRAEEQSLIGLNAPARFASRTVSYIKAVFELGENWHGYDSVRAVWTTDFASICTVLDSFGACTVPHEVLDRVGSVYVNLVGSIAENDELTDRLTTYPLEAICVDASAVVCGSETAEITPSQFEQFADAVRSDADRAEAGARDAESARADAIDARDAASASQYLASRYAVQSADSANASAQSARESADSATTSAQSAGDARESAEDAERAKDAILGMRAEAETLPAGSDATASYSDGVLSLGIPKGDTGAKGAKGDKGDTGATPDMEIGVVSTLEPGKSATATITGTAERPVLSLGIPKGAQGDVGMAEFLDAVTVDELSDSVPYKLKATPADAGSRELLHKIVGGTVAWNQLVSGIRTSGATYTESNDVITVTPTANGNRIIATPLDGSSYMPVIKGHVYLQVVTLKSDGTNNVGFQNYLYVDCTKKTASNSWTDLAQIAKASDSGEAIIQIWSVNKTEYQMKKDSFQFFDLTAMFGTTIADYIYSLEQANAGAGVAWFKKLFPKDYYEYNAGELISVSGLESHDTVGFNQLDPANTKVGGVYNPAVGNTINLDSSGATYSGTNPIEIDVTTSWRGCCLISEPLVAGQQYEITFKTSAPNTADKRISQYLIDADNKVVTNPYNWVGNSGDNITRTITPTESGLRCAITIQSTSVQKITVTDPCIHLVWSGYRNGEYEPYEKHSYPLDNSLTLRGIPKLDSSNNLYYDGDEYASDGSVTRKYGIVDLGTLTWYFVEAQNCFYTYGVREYTKQAPNAVCSKYPYVGIYADLVDKSCGYIYGNAICVRDESFNKDTAAFKAAMSGVYFVYELATPTTETAEAYTQIQSCEAGGTEEFVTDSIVPVGNESVYPRTLADTMPRTDGTYTIGLTVSGGKRVVGWVQS